jgi:hypothetical protein
MSEVFIPHEAIEAARYALGCVYEPTESNLDDRIPALNSAYERRFGPAVWRAAIKRVLDSGEVTQRHLTFDLSFTFFRDLETKHHGAMLTSEWERLGTEDRAYLKKIDPTTLDPSTRSILLARALDAAADDL